MNTLPDDVAARIEYRALRATDDVDAITDLLHQAYAPLANAGMRFLASHQDSNTTAKRMRKGETFVAVHGNVIVGVITLAEIAATRGTPFYDRPDVADFGQFAVHPLYQRRGIGSRLLNLVESRAKEKGVQELALNTSEHAHHLIAMYEKKGYRFVEFAEWAQVNYRSKIMSKRLQ